MCKAAPGYGSSSASQILMCMQATTGGVLLKCRFTLSSRGRGAGGTVDAGAETTLHSEPLALEAPEVRSEHLVVDRQNPDSQPTPACQGLVSLEMIGLKPVSKEFSPAL